ncbi:MAG: dephospho-CoA kinase [bacterium]|nr:dephospho-CoA kinase [bacterium]
MRAMIIGLTGQIGAGKSAAARILEGFGALIVDADLIGRQVVEQSFALRKKLAHTFGKGVLDRRGSVRRRKLASRAFVDDSSRDKLNQIVHPFLLKELRRQVKSGTKTHDVVVIDAALLLFWEMDDEVDFVVVIHAGRELRLARMEQRGIARADAAAREKAQLPYSEFQKRANRLILNNGKMKDLERKLADFWQRSVVRGSRQCL